MNNPTEIYTNGIDGTLPSSFAKVKLLGRQLLFPACG
jgi:hypothetical protein